MAHDPTALRLWRTLQGLPLGKSGFTRLICLKAPYFASIHPLVMELEPGNCIASLKLRRAVTNHIGGVHAIALCNLAELAGGLMTEVSTPATHRWIPRGMSVDYRKVARSRVRAVARFAEPAVFGDSGYALPVQVSIYDQSEDVVFTAEIRMWISPRRSG